MVLDRKQYRNFELKNASNRASDLKLNWGRNSYLMCLQCGTGTDTHLWSGLLSVVHMPFDLGFDLRVMCHNC